MFATASGNVRRNRLSDFRNVRASGLIAMKLDEGDRLIGVATCREGDDVLLAARNGRCIRFQITEDSLRVFAGRDSSGVRGLRLAAGDEVVSLSVLRHVEVSTEERAAYLRAAAARRRAAGEDDAPEAAPPAEAANGDGDEEAVADVTLDEGRFAELEAQEEFLLTVTTGGFGKRSSAYEYRTAGRGGQGIANITLGKRNGGAVAATFPVRPGDDVMLVTDAGRLIRVPADQVRITGRQAMGVTLFRLNAGEHVTSVFPVLDQGEDEGPGTDGPAGDAGPGDMGPGDMGPGDMGPGDMGPGDMGPGDMGPGDMGPGDMGPGDMGPGDMGPGDAPAGRPAEDDLAPPGAEATENGSDG